MRESLVEYAAGTLEPADRAAVEAHLAGCAECRGELAGWVMLANGARAPHQPAPPGPELVTAVLTRSARNGPGPAPGRRLRWSLALLVAEARLVRPSVLLTSALVMALGVITAMGHLGGPAAGGDQVLGLLAPIVAAAGIASGYGTRQDPVFELVAATPTSPRLIALTGVALVFGYDLLLALTASGLLTAAGSTTSGLTTLIVAWLGPMALLSALSLVVAVWVGPDIAIGVTVAAWTLRVLADSVFVHAAGLSAAVRALWSTNAATGLVTAVLVVAAVILAGRGEPARRSRATHPV